MKSSHHNSYGVLLAGVVALLVAFPPHVQAARYLVDFGPNDGNGAATASLQYGNSWNNWHTNSATVGLTVGMSCMNLVDTTGGASAVSLIYIMGSLAPNGGSSLGGLTIPSPALLGDFAVTNATLDYFYTGTSGTISITNLNANSMYSFRMFGSRSNTEARITRYVALGLNGAFTNTLKTSGTGIGADGVYNGNDSNIVSIIGVGPFSNKEIQLSIQRASASFGYINILEIYERQSSTISALKTSSSVIYGSPSVTLTGVVSAAGSVYALSNETVTVTIDALSSNAVVSGTSGVFSVNFPAASLTAGTHTISYSFAGDYSLNATNDASTQLTVTRATPSIGSVTASPTIANGESMVTLAGVVSAMGPVYPTNGAPVTVTIDGVSTNAIISGEAGGFSINFPTASLAAGVYPITYSYAGDNNLNAAVDNSATTLTVLGAKVTPVIANVTASQSIVCGTVSVTLTGVVSAAGPVYPADGETMTVTVNGVGTNAVISGGGFSVAVGVSALRVPGPYPITYAYGGNTYLNAAETHTTTALTVTKATPVITNVTASQTIFLGTASVTLTGEVSAAGSVYPASSEIVSVIIDGITSNALISGSAGLFSVSFPTASMTVGVHSVTYEYAGDANLNAASHSATALTVSKVKLIPVNSATAHASSGTAALAFDGNSTTRWESSASDPQWITIDLGEDFTLDTITLDWEAANSKDYTLRMRTSAQGLDDPITPANWTQIASITGRGGIIDGSGGIVEDRFTFTNGTFAALVGTSTSATVSTSPKGRYLMIHGTTRATVYGHSIFEVKVYGQGVGGTVGVQIQTAPSLVNLTARGVTDWRYWFGGEGGPRTLSSVERKAGGSAIREGLVVSYTQAAKTGPIPFSWTDGTPLTVATTNDMVKLRQGGPSQASFTVDLAKWSEGELRLWFGWNALGFSRTVTVTAAYPDGTTASQSVEVAGNDTQYRECVIPFKPDGDTALAITIATSGESELYVGPVAVRTFQGTVFKIR